MISTPIKLVLQNTKGIEFKVVGHCWSDGTIRCNNPKPKKYPFQFLYTDTTVHYKKDRSRLYWLRDTDSDLDELSPFRVKSMEAILPKPAKKTAS